MIIQIIIPVSGLRLSNLMADRQDPKKLSPKSLLPNFLNYLVDMDLQPAHEHRNLLNALLQAQNSSKTEDREHFSKLCVEHFYQDIFFICYAYFRQDTWDIAADVFLKIMTCKIALLPAESYGHLKNYLSKMASNYCISKKTQQLTKVIYETSYYHNKCQSEAIWNNFYQSDRVASLHEAIVQLPLNYQVVIRYQLNGFKVKEIADMLDTSETAVSNRILRAKHKLRVILQ